MKALIWTRYGPPEVLQLREVEKPTPRANEVLIKVHAATVTAGDYEIRSLRIPPLYALLMRMYNGLRRPKRITILGQELAGEIEAVGRDVRRWKEGDGIFAATGFHFGAYAEYACLPEDGPMAAKPRNMSLEEAAAIPVGGLHALHFLRAARIASGQAVLINGAGGSIGTFAVQLAKSSGAEVTGVDSTAKWEMLRSIGADHVVDHMKEDFTKRGKTYDAIFDVVGKASLSDCMKSLKEGGVYVSGNSWLLRRIRQRWVSATSGRRVIDGGGSASYDPENLTFLKALIEAGKVRTVIDRRFPLKRTAEAHRYVETGQKKGNVVISVGHDAAS